MSTRQPSDNLGIRQRALNARVNETFACNDKFENVKDTPDLSELDKLYKIDLAAKYKNVDYIVDVLKSADSLYTTRALKKSLWLFDDEYVHIINPEYLQSEIFPYTSLKMKRKILSHVSLHVRTEERAAIFFHYCINTKLPNIAFKFVLYTSESFKTKVLSDFAPCFYDIVRDKLYVKHLIGRSFNMLSAFLEIVARDKQALIYAFEYLYKDNNDKYLDIVERYGRRPFDSTISDDIMKKHKNRVLARPSFYFDLLNRNSLVKYSSTEDVKIYAVDFLPEWANDFWYMHYYTKFKYLLELIPHNETYAFIKRIFNVRYPKSEFETTKMFYDQNYYIFMTCEQQETWALDHIKSEKQILGVGRDFIWYGFVNFKEAFEAVKKFIFVTKDLDIRTEMLKVLVQSAKTDDELETLFVYYHKRHLNETRFNKIHFLKKVIDDHNVYEFNERCWISFHALLISMDMFNNLDYSDGSNVEFKTVTLIYNIVHQIELTEQLMNYALNDFNVNDISLHKHKLNCVKSTILYEYLYPFYMNIILGYKHEPFTSIDESLVRRYFENVVTLMKIYHHKNIETKSKKMIRCQPRRKERFVNHNLSDRELLRRLKKDLNVLSSALPGIAERFELWPYNINTFLKKIKVYFADDVAKKMFNHFESSLAKELNIKGTQAAINGIFQLGNEQYKIDFMKKHAPVSIKIDHDKIDAQQLRIQKAICRFASHSRPPVPLENILLYLKGDYVQHCLHMFDMFLANLSLPLCLEFVKSIVDTPVSVQKHGIRLAFQCFSDDNLVSLITKIWKRSKNVSLRFVIYKALFNEVVEGEQKDLFEVLKNITLDLREDDEDEIFGMLTSNKLSEKFLGAYYEAVWGAVSNFKDKEPSIQRKIMVVTNIYEHIQFMPEEFVRAVVDEHLNYMFIKKNIRFYKSQDTELQKKKWKLVKIFIIYFVNHSDTPIKYKELTRYIIKHCLVSWYEVHFDKFVYQKFCSDFIRDLKSIGYLQKDCNNGKSIPIFEVILNVLVLALPLHEIYMVAWDLKLTVVNLRLINNYVEGSSGAVSYFNYGKEIGAIVVKFIINGQYFEYLSYDIKNVIYSNVQDLCRHINIGETNALISVASGLVEQKIVETHVLALQLLPQDCEYKEINDFKKVLSKISQESKVQYAMHLMLSNHAKRASLL